MKNRQKRTQKSNITFKKFIFDVAVCMGSVWEEISFAFLRNGYSKLHVIRPQYFVN